MNVAIRHVQTPEEGAVAADLQRVVWGGDETPAHVLLTAAHNGGICAGAFVDSELAGFVWGFLGLDDRDNPPRLKHCSHQLAVHPAYRGRGLGFLLKRFQWEFVRHQGVDLVTWTYDPLLAANAHLNIARLGAVCNIYRRNEYGELRDDLNAGLATDRFQVDLWVNSARVCSAMQGARSKPQTLDNVHWLNEPVTGRPLPLPGKSRLMALQPNSDPVALAIPSDFQTVRVSSAGLAAEWRFATRDVFETLFEHGYSVIDFVRRPGYGCYLLQTENAAGL